MLMAGLSVSLDRRCSSMGLGPGSPACNPQQTPIVMLLGFPVPVDPFFFVVLGSFLKLPNTKTVAFLFPNLSWHPETPEHYKLRAVTIGSRLGKWPKSF